MVYGKSLQLSENDINEIYLKSRYLDLLNESIDMDTGEGGTYKPVFIVLIYSDSFFDKVVGTVVKDEKYWHSAIGFGPSLKYLYSFNFGEYDANPIKGGLSFEDIEGYKEEYPNAELYVSCILLSDERYAALKKALRWFIVHKKKTSFDFFNLLRAYYNKKTKNGLKFNLVCSTFVDTVLKQAGVDLNQGMVTNLVRPDDLISKNGEKQFKIFEGNILEYNPIEAKKIVEKWTEDKSYEFFDKAPIKALA